MDWGQAAGALFERDSVDDSLDMQAERMELEEYAVDSHKAEDNHCSLEALGHPIDHHQNPCE